MKMRTALVAMAFGGLVGAAYLHPPLASADQYDFISVLDNNGVSYSDILGMIDLGKQTCYELRRGSDIMSMMDYLVDQQGFANFEAGLIVSAASNTMCPDTQWRIQEVTSNSQPEPQPQLIYAQ